MKKIEIGNRIEIGGGYDYRPAFLEEPCGTIRIGEVIKFIPGQNTEPAAVIKLECQITANGITGDIFILELRYEDQTWETEGPVHIELCDFEPEDKTWKDRRKGAWIESHASLRILNATEHQAPLDRE